jgi:predicted DNA-binding WGR domain protein
MIYLERTDPARNMARYYCLTVEKNLFGEFSLVRTWGRIGRTCQMQVELWTSREDCRGCSGTQSPREAPERLCLRGGCHYDSRVPQKSLGSFSQLLYTQNDPRVISRAWLWHPGSLLYSRILSGPPLPFPGRRTVHPRPHRSKNLPHKRLVNLPNLIASPALEMAIQHLRDSLPSVS